MREGGSGGRPRAQGDADCRCILSLIVGRRCSASSEAIAIVGLDEVAGGGQGSQALVEGGGADAAQRAQLGERQRAVDIGERHGDALVDGAARRGWRWMRIDDLERKRVAALRELERDGGHGESRPVLDGEVEIIAVAAQIEIGVAPGVELG